MKAISATKAATTAKVAGARGIRATCAGRRSVSARAVPLPDLPYDYGALEPYISGDIMKLHHQMHHGTYVKVSAQLLPLPAESVCFLTPPRPVRKKELQRAPGEAG